MNLLVDRPDFTSFKPFQSNTRGYTPNLGDPNRPMQRPQMNRPSSAASMRGDTIKVKQPKKTSKRLLNSTFSTEGSRPGSAMGVRGGGASSGLDTTFGHASTIGGGSYNGTLNATLLSSTTTKTNHSGVAPPPVFVSEVPNAAVEAQKLRKNDWFNRNRRDGFDQRLGAPLWKQCGVAPPVFGTKRNQPVLASNCSSNSLLSSSKQLNRSNNNKTNASPSRAFGSSVKAPSAATSAVGSRPSTAMSRTSNRSMNSTTTRFTHNRPASSSVSQQLRRNSGSSAGYGEEDGGDVSSDDGEAVVATLDNWQPKPTEMQYLARNILSKYRTAHHSRSADSITVWDYVLEKRMGKDDPRVIAEMNRYENVGDADKVQSTAAAVVAESLGLDEY